MPQKTVEQRREYQAAYRAANREALLAGNKSWRARNPDKAFAFVLKTRYGISLAEYRRLLDKQGGGCAICGTKDWGKRNRPCVDHDHATGRVRGLLCINCNTGIGMFDDDPDRMRLAIRYLE